MTRSGSQSGTTQTRRTAIPTAPTSFIGRERERAQIARLLDSSRLITLTGAAGCGKTRLALRVARDAADGYAGGAQWVALAQVTDPELVAQATAKALRLPEQPRRSSLERLVEALQDEQALLVLDNCEHLLQACAGLAETLLAETGVSILATSREPLRVTGEKHYPVPPMSLPPPALPPASVDALAQSDAVQLFVTRARAVLPAFELSAENGPLVAEICRNLDGIPLALELASARVNVLTLEQIVGWLDNHFDLLFPASHVTHVHHETLRAAIDWSHDLLSEAEQVLLRRLSVFSGGCSLAAVEAVCAGNAFEPGQTLELIASLVGKSLVAAETLGRSQARYSMLETIRQYATEKLRAAGERATLRDRHLQYFLQVSEETESKVRGEYQQLWLNYLEDQYDNIRAAMTWSLESGQIEEGLRISISLYQFWTVRDYVEEGAAWLERLLARADDAVSAVVLAKALVYAVTTASFRGNRDAQTAYARRAADLAQDVGQDDEQALVWALSAQAHGERGAGNYEAEFALYHRIIDLRRRLGHRYYLAIALSTGSFAAMSLGAYGQAREMLDEALPLLHEIGDPYRIAMALNFSGDLARCVHDNDHALAAYGQSITLLRELDAVRDLASALHNLGHTCLRRGDVDRSRALFEESLALHREQRNRPGIAECLVGYAALALAADLPAAGARLLAAAVGLGGEQNLTTWAATRMAYEHYLEQARTALSETAFRKEQAAGRALSLEQAIGYAGEVAGKAVSAQEARRELDGLTPREREVTTLIAQAKSNDEIAAELVISKRTVEKHIANIRAKLAFTKRAQIVRWALESGLVNHPDETTPQ